MTKNKNLRPTQNKVKEAVFNILNIRIKNSLFIDMFAGTGNIGITALEKGAEKVIFVEGNTQQANQIKDRLITLRQIEKGEVWRADATLKYIIKKLMLLNPDILYIDPPYSKGLALKVLNTMDSLINPNCNIFIIIEDEFGVKYPDELTNLKKIKDYRYGQIVLSCYTMEDSFIKKNILEK